MSGATSLDLARASALPLVLLACAACETPSPGRRTADDPASTEASPVDPGAAAEPSGSADGPLPAERPASPPGALPPPRPEEPPSPERACKEDGDCELVPDDCRECPPCEPTWRVAKNRREVQRIVAERARIECPPIACQQCDVPGLHGYVGEGAACLNGQCVVREP